MTQERAIRVLKDDLRVSYRPEKREALEMAIEALQQPQIVLCKDCRFHNNPEERASETYWMPCEEFVTDGNWFCGWGKPKEGDGE